MSTKYIASNWRLPNKAGVDSYLNDNYGLSFDGSEFINLGNVNDFSFDTGDFTVSSWCKIDSGVSTFRWIFGFGGTNGLEIGLNNTTDNTLRLWIAGDNINSTESISSDIWHNIIVKRESGVVTAFVDNTSLTLGSGGNASIVNNTNSFIGVWSDGFSDDFQGSISELAVFDYALTSTQISTLYGSSSLGAGNPMALKPAPVAFYPLGDNSSGNPLTQPNEAVEDASVFDFVSADGDRILCSPTPTPGTGPLNSINNAISISLWIKTTQSSVNQYPMLRSYLGGTNRDWEIRQRSDTNLFHIYFFNTSGTQLDIGLTGSTDPQGDAYIVTNDGNWHNVLVVYDGTDTAKIYVDGILQGSNTSASFGTLRTNARTTIGGYNNSGNAFAGAGSWNGQISNAVVWNSDQSSEKDNIYNSGVPATTYTNTPTAWYKLDQSANWEADSSGAWQIPDAVSAYPQSFDFSSSNIQSNNLNISTAISISAWVKTTTTTGTRIIVNEDNWGSNRNWHLYIANSNKIIFRAYNPSGNIVASLIRSAAGEVTDGKWHNVVATWDGTTNADTVKVSIDNNIQTATATGTGIKTSSSALSIGSGSDASSTHPFTGQISNIVVWDADQSSEISNIYNSGVPVLSYTNTPSAWYKLDNTATFSTNWSVPDASGNGNTGTSSGMTEQNLVNNNVSGLNGESSGMTSANLVLTDLTRNLPYDSYSFNFDGTNEIEISQFTLSGAFTLSVWLNADTFTGGQALLFGDNDSNSYKIEFNGTSTIALKNAGGNTSFTGSAWNTNEWQHLLISRDATDNVVIYRNATSWSTGTKSGDILFDRISGFNSSASHFNGKLSNISIFDEALTSTEVMKLYSNGMPQDLTSFTPAPVAWWTLGSNSFFNGSNFICKDLIGSNDGTSVNAGVDALQGNTPRSEANGTGANMDIPTNLEGQTKYSNNNSWSINQSESARVQDTP